MIYSSESAPGIEYVCTIGTKGLEFDEYKHWEDKLENWEHKFPPLTPNR